MDDFPVHDFDPENLPRGILARVGLIIIQANSLEKTVQEAIAGILGVDFEYGMAVTTHMTMPLRYSVLHSTAEIRLNDLDQLDALDELIDRTKRAFDKRNRFAHREWFTHADGSGTYIVKETARTRLEVDQERVDVTDLDAAFEEIRNLTFDWIRFIERNGLDPVIPDEFRPRGHKSKSARKKRRNP